MSGGEEEKEEEDSCSLTLLLAVAVTCAMSGGLWILSKMRRRILYFSSMEEDALILQSQCQGGCGYCRRY